LFCREGLEKKMLELEAEEARLLAERKKELRDRMEKELAEVSVHDRTGTRRHAMRQKQACACCLACVATGLDTCWLLDARAGPQVQEREKSRFELAERALREEFEASLSLKRSLMEREEQLMEENQRERRERLERLQQACAR
jgi:hypothetical protein